MSKKKQQKKIRITFEDRGQDFLTWDINNDNVVENCRPFQGIIWNGCKVVNKKLEIGDKVVIQDRIITGARPRTIQYPIINVE